jgi:two-component system, sensor histidine kinase
MNWAGASLLVAAIALLSVWVAALYLRRLRHLSRKVGVTEIVEEGPSSLPRESQDFLSSVIENIPNMIFVKDANELKFVRFNRAGEKLIGISRKELIGKNDYDFFPKDQADSFTEKDRQVLAAREVLDIPEEPLTTKDGIRILHTKKIPIVDESGVALYLLGISEDITEHKKAESQKLKLFEEQAGRREAERTARHFSFLSEAIKTLTTSADYNVTLNAFAKILVTDLADWCVINMAEEEDKAKTTILFHHDPEKADLANRTREKYPPKQDGLLGTEYSIRSGQSQFFPEVDHTYLSQVAWNEEHRQMMEELGMNSVLIVPLKARDRILGAIALIRGDQKKKYDELDLALAQNLADRASFVIENARLFQRAQEANRAKTEFLANMSHEIRTPLGAVIGFAELLAESSQIDGEEKKFANTIIRNGKQLLKIVDEILDISKVESARVSVEYVSFDPRQVIGDVSMLLQPLAMEKDIELKVEPCPELPSSVVSDPTRLRQILINVLGNAIKFTSQGTVSLTVDAGSLAQEKMLLRFRIRDSGIGIQKQQAALLFKPFSQADGSTSRRFGGTGLGLYLSKKLAQILGGDLILETSESGKGSTFLLTIPVTVSRILHASKSSQKSIVSQPVHHLKILVVDDSLDNRVLLERYLSRLGHEIICAENGRQAVETALGGEYDMVLMDIQMPEMDGFQALEKLREKKYGKPVVALTAYAMKGDREICLKKGFDDYLVKPVSRESLAEVLRKVPFYFTQST